MSTGVHLLTYADRLAGDLPGLRALLAESLPELVGVHVLPFFDPFDGDDTGFDPDDHRTVDPRLGTWDDVRALASDGLDVTADLIVNHVSARSTEFRAWLATNEHDGLFLTFSTVFPEGATSDEITAFYRPRPGLPFTAYQRADGRRELVWTTFMPSQVDIDVRHPQGRAYLRGILETFADAGVRTVRVDAVGYAIKTPGTDSFMTAETLDYVGELTADCHALGLEVLVEVHAHHTQQEAIAPLVDLVYDFATPPLLLHALGRGTTERLAQWLGRRPANAITVLDTHDGIGVIDAGPGPAGLLGLLDEAEMAEIFADAAIATHGRSAEFSVVPGWAPMPHQINATYYSVLGENDERYLLTRAFQLFLPGTPQIYYVGLLAGADDADEARATGQGRDVNRHRYTSAEVQEALGRPVVRALLELCHLRADVAAFGGVHTWSRPTDATLVQTWTAPGSGATLEVDMATQRFRLEVREGDRVRAFAGVDDLVRARDERGAR